MESYVLYTTYRSSITSRQELCTSLHLVHLHPNAVHLVEQSGQDSLLDAGLFAVSGTTPDHRVDLVDEEDGRRSRPGLLEDLWKRSG